jgi:hypothetical protein
MWMRRKYRGHQSFAKRLSKVRRSDSEDSSNYQT